MKKQGRFFGLLLKLKMGVVVKVILGVIVGLVLLVGWWGLFPNNVPTSSTVLLLSIDPLFSHSQQEELISLFEKDSSIVPLIHKVRDACPAVQSIAAQRLSSGNIKVLVKGVEPHLLVNNDIVVGDLGQVLRRDSYHEQSVYNLPFMMAASNVLNEQKFPHQMLSVLKHHGDRLLKNFSIIWASSTKVVLRDNCAGDFSIVCDVDHVPDENQIRDCRFVYMQLKPALARSVVADVRFDNQIVAYYKQNDVINNYTKSTG